MDSKYLPYLVLGVAIVGGVAYLGFDFTDQKVRTPEEFAAFAKNTGQPCDLGRPGKDKDGKPMRIFTWDECRYRLQGLPTVEGDCIKKNAKGGSWAYECSLMNK